MADKALLAGINNYLKIGDLRGCLNDVESIAVYVDGATLVFDAATAIPTNFNPTGATNGFLWPLASGQDVSGR